MSLSEQYFKHMLAGNSEAAYHMERKYALDGYPPELVSAGLAAIDAGEDPLDAILDYAELCNDGKNNKVILSGSCTLEFYQWNEKH